MLGLDSDENSWADYPEVMPHVREHKLVAPEGQGAAVLIHCKIVILLDLCAVRLANPKSITISDDLVHRGSARLVDKDGALWRPMHKWQFLRTEEPTAPTWDHDADSFPAQPFDPLDDMTPANMSVWSWLKGQPPPTPALSGEEAGHLLADRERGDEPVRLGSAHALGQAAHHGDAEALEVLATGLADARQAVRRCSVHGLAAAGDAATEVALAALGSDVPRTIGVGADVLGECAVHPTLAAVDAVSAAMERLLAAIGSTPAPERGAKQDAPAAAEYAALGACAESLGNLAQRAVAAADGALYSAVAAALVPLMAPPPNTPQAEKSMGNVQRKAAEAAMALCNAGDLGGAESHRLLVSGLRQCLGDENRYVIASGAEGLRRLGAAGRRPAVQSALEALVEQRWCPVTTPASQF